MNTSSFDATPGTEARGASCAGIVFVGDRDARPSLAQFTAPPRDVQPASESSLDADVRDFFDWLCASRGVVGDRYRPSVVRRRQAACLRAAGCGSLAEARIRLERDQVRLDRALGAVLIGVSSFFRDGAPFDALATELSKLAWRQKRQINVLSVGCSNGQELYSTAIVLAQAGLLERSTLVGVDCRAGAIEAAAEGLFDDESLMGIPEAIRSAWFLREGTGFRATEELRRHMRWHVADAFAFRTDDRFDIVLCRNVAIYLQPESSRALWASLNSMLRPGGLLMVGKAERPHATGLVSRIAPCLYQQRETSH